MIVPQFELDQNDEYIFVTIKAPMADIKETELHVEEDVFIFWSKPYFLRLSLPGKLVQNFSEILKIDSNKFYIKLYKLTKGENFEGLDMITKLLIPPKTSKLTPVQVINTSHNQNDNNCDNFNIEDENFDWYLNLNYELDHKVENEDDISREKYGFGNRYFGVISKLEEEIWDLIELKYPESKSAKSRIEERINAENEHFDDNHYLFDLYDQNELIEKIIKFRPEWELCDEIKFNDYEIFRLKNLPKYEYIFSRKEKFQLLLGLVDIIFAYAYDVRTTEGEHSVESGWTISKLSSTLSWFEVFNSLDKVLIASVRRSLCYPLYRNWALAMKIIADAIKILEKGRTFVIKCFLDIHKLFNESGDYRYIFNNLYITDYCVWLQTVNEQTFKSLANAIKKMSLNKETIGLDLKLLEDAAILAIQDSQKVKKNELFVQS